MATRSSKYWADRFTAMDDEIYKYTEKYIKDVGRQFDRATRQIDKDLAYWYERLAENNDISYDAARKLLSDDELADFKMTLEEYIEHGRELGIDDSWVKAMVNASAKVHISRLDEIKIELTNTVENLYHEYEGSIEARLSELIPDTYARTAYEIAKGTGVATTLHALDSEAVSSFLNTPWCTDGKVFSGRIWSRRDDLVNTLNTQLTQLLITGKDPQQAINTIAKDFAVEKSAAGRLIMTESAAFANEARKKCMKDLDVEEYEFVATLDSHTSDLCRGMDGQHFPMSQFKIGVNAPPLHCNCRSCTVPYFNDEFTKGETRAARDGKDEGYEQVPSNMKYEDWKKKYITLNRELDRKAENIGKFEYLKVPMQMKSVRNVAEKYGIDISDLKISIKRDQNLIGASITGWTDRKFIGRIEIYPNAFLNEKELSRTLVHEKIHVTQIKEYSARYVDEHIAEFETEAYNKEQEWWDTYGVKVR